MSERDYRVGDGVWVNHLWKHPELEKPKKMQHGRIIEVQEDAAFPNFPLFIVSLDANRNQAYLAEELELDDNMTALGRCSE